MPLELNVHQFRADKLGKRKLLRTVPYKKFIEQGEGAIFVQNGVAMYEDGTVVKEFPGWFNAVIERDGEAGFKKVGGIPKPAKGK